MKMRSIILLVSVLFAFSCSKNDPVIQTPAFLNARADGVVKDCNVVRVTLTAGILQINAQTTAGDVTFVLTVNNYTSGQIGTFNIGQGNFNTALYREGTTSYSAGTSAGTGRIQITNASSTQVDGTFEFTGVSTGGTSKVISEGRFTAYF